MLIFFLNYALLWILTLGLASSWHDIWEEKVFAGDKVKDFCTFKAPHHVFVTYILVFLRLTGTNRQLHLCR